MHCIYLDFEEWYWCSENPSLISLSSLILHIMYSKRLVFLDARDSHLEKTLALLTHCLVGYTYLSREFLRATNVGQPQGF